MKFYTWTAAQTGALWPYTGDWNFLWFQTSAAQPLCVHSAPRLHLRDPRIVLCLQPQIFISTPNLCGETLCQKLHFMYYRQPFREYSCVINFHFKAKSSWNDVREWVWSGAHSNGNKKKIKNKIIITHRGRECHTVAHNKNMHFRKLLYAHELLNVCACTQSSSGSQFGFRSLVPHLTIAWKQVSTRTWCSSRCFFLLVFIVPPTQCRRHHPTPPPPPPT